MIGLAKRKNHRIAAAVLIIIAVGILLYALLTPQGTTNGAILSSQLRLKYSDGSEVTVGSGDTKLFSLMQGYNTLENAGKRIDSIYLDASLKFKVDSKVATSVKTQYWGVYFIELNGPFFTGVRGYTSLTGFGDLPIPYSGGTRTYRTDRWWNFMNARIFTSLDQYYSEKGSGLQIGNLNIGSELAKGVNDAIGGLPIIGDLANKLTGLAGTVTVKDGDYDTLVRWSRSGPEFYTDMKRTNWKGLALNLGEAISFGAGEYASMNVGDKYKLTMKVTVFYRWQDATGEWAPWKAKTVQVASIDLNVTEGYWTYLNVDVGQNGYINWEQFT